VNGVNPARANQDEKDELSRVIEHIFSKIADGFETKAAFGVPIPLRLIVRDKTAKPVRRAYNRAAYWDERVKTATWWESTLADLA